MASAKAGPHPMTALLMPPQISRTVSRRCISPQKLHQLGADGVLCHAESIQSGIAIGDRIPGELRHPALAVVEEPQSTEFRR